MTTSSKLHAMLVTNTYSLLLQTLSGNWRLFDEACALVVLPSAAVGIGHRLRHGRPAGRVGGARHRGHDAKFKESSQTCCRHYFSGGGTGDWRDEWAARGIADMTQAASVSVGGAVARRAMEDGAMPAAAPAQTPWVAPGYRRRPPRPHQHY